MSHFRGFTGYARVSRGTDMSFSKMILAGLLSLGLIGGLSGGFGGAARAETLADALVYTYEHSGLLEQNRALLRAADEDIAQANASLQPIISWSATAMASAPFAPDVGLITANIRLSLDLLLYDFGATQLATDAQKETILATRQSLVMIEQNVMLRTVRAYMNVLRDSAFVELRDANLRLITQELQAARDRFNVGEVTRTDVSFAEARLAAARSLHAAAQGSLVQSVEEFRAAVGRNPGRLTIPSLAPTSRNVNEAKEFAVRHHPGMLQVQHSVAAAELNIARAEAALNPTVRLNGAVGFDQNTTVGGQLGVTIAGPITQGGQLASQIRQAMARRDASRAQLHITRQSIEQGVGNAYAIMTAQRAGRAARDQQVRAAQVAFNGVREEATLGARTTLDVLNAEQELLDARASLISSQVDEIIASYSVLAAMGLLTAEHLNLPVQTYDPAAYYNLVKDAPLGQSEQGQALDRVLRAIGQ